MRVLVCGNRNYTNRAFIYATLDLWNAIDGIDVLIEGEASGADTIAREWAEMHDIVVWKFPADWAKYGKSAGPIRNLQMLTMKPDYVLAFHDDIEHSKGTKHMVNNARIAGITTHVFALPDGPTS